MGTQLRELDHPAKLLVHEISARCTNSGACRVTAVWRSRCNDLASYEQLLGGASATFCFR